jgi:hypothetical protein
MKALIIIREKDCDWLRKISPAAHPAMFPVCNKPILEYLVDFAILHGCKGIRVVLDEPEKDIETYFEQGQRWGIAMSYGNFREHETIDQILDKNSRFCEGEPVLILDGFFFIHYDKEQKYGDLPENVESSLIVSCATGSVVFTGNRFEPGNFTAAADRVNFALSPLESLDDIHHITLQVVAAEQHHYVLPGYGANKGIILGRNVEIGRDVIINEPAAIGNNVRLLGDAVIGPFAVIGNNVIVDQGTHIEESVILDDSYLGRDLTFRQKVVKGNRIFSCRDREDLVIEDGFLVSSMQGKRGLPLPYTLANGFIAFTLLALLGVPCLLLTVLAKLQNDWQWQEVKYYRNNSGETISVKKWVGNRNTLTSTLLSAFLLDRFPLLFMAMRGRIRLVGNSLLEVSRENELLLEDFQEYQPGVFGYSEAEHVLPESLEANITERFFAAHRSFSQDCRMLLRILCTNLLSQK